MYFGGLRAPSHRDQSNAAVAGRAPERGVPDDPAALGHRAGRPCASGVPRIPSRQRAETFTRATGASSRA
eukprot:4885279-Pyramimonas_sp.AAC.1